MLFLMFYYVNNYILKKIIFLFESIVIRLFLQHFKKNK